jgi:hypothetical protein
MAEEWLLKFPGFSYASMPFLRTFLLNIAQKLTTGDLNGTLHTSDKSGL